MKMNSIFKFLRRVLILAVGMLGMTIDAICQEMDVNANITVKSSKECGSKIVFEIDVSEYQVGSFCVLQSGDGSSLSHWLDVTPTGEGIHPDNPKGTKYQSCVLPYGANVPMYQTAAAPAGGCTFWVVVNGNALSIETAKPSCGAEITGTPAISANFTKICESSYPTLTVDPSSFTEVSPEYTAKRYWYLGVD